MAREIKGAWAWLGLAGLAYQHSLGFYTECIEPGRILIWTLMTSIHTDSYLYSHSLISICTVLYTLFNTIHTDNYLNSDLLIPIYNILLQLYLHPASCLVLFAYSLILDISIHIISNTCMTATIILFTVRSIIDVW